ncbi:MAG: UDP-N-acetylmuramate--L-alanine ligase [Candidatus Azobacteroides sp.]|nr:UDP-N-acetylmuramate--L-alanine ligase [Candidatus Azobacteroides sp.]
MESFERCNHFFFIGIAGTGMSAIAQYLKGVGKKISGSDRLFNSETKLLIQEQFERQDIHCYLQDASGITPDIDVVVISTAIEESNIELQKARSLGIPVVKRSELLSSISREKRTIAVGGTSGKSTTTAMIFHVMQACGLEPSIMNGAGLSSLQKKGLPGNAWVGKSDWLVIEADESDGSIVNYIPEIAVLLNIDKDHKEFDELLQLFQTFKSNTKNKYIVNQSHSLSKSLSQNKIYDFGVGEERVGFSGSDFEQKDFSISFKCNGISFCIPVIGKHNMENALAAVAVCNAAGISVEQCAEALRNYEGIYRRTQLVGEANGVYVIDDFAHNPAEVACAIQAAQSVGKRVFAWFQPHGYGPLKFFYKELIKEVLSTLRENDYFILSDVYYAGGTVNKEITSEEVAKEMQKHNNQILFFPDRNDMLPYLKQNCRKGDVVLIMGARDTTLSDFAKEVNELCPQYD